MSSPHVDEEAEVHTPDHAHEGSDTPRTPTAPRSSTTTEETPSWAQYLISNSIKLNEAMEAQNGHILRPKAEVKEQSCSVSYCPASGILKR